MSAKQPQPIPKGVEKPGTPLPPPYPKETAQEYEERTGYKPIKR